MQFTASTDTITRERFTLTLTTEPDDSHGAPWDECDGHGPVSDWTTRDKAPGELVLNTDQDRKRFYDYAAACRMARADGWGSLWPYEMKLERQRGGAWIARAVAWGKPDLASAPRRDINRAIGELYEMRKAQFPSARAYAANAARADYEYLRAWCNGDWHYVVVCVTASRNGIKLASAYLGGVEDSYIAECANELIDEALDEAHATVASLTE